MKGAFSSFRVTVFISLPLVEKFEEGHLAGCKNPKVPVQCHDVFVLFKRQGGANGNRFLPDTREPFGDFALPQQVEHFLLNDPWFYDCPVKSDQRAVIIIQAVVGNHDGAKVGCESDKLVTDGADPSAVVNENAPQQQGVF
jgi:hypothetical protein